MRYSANSSAINNDSLIMYVDMNSFFASCEQQLDGKLRNRPIGVCAGDKSFSVIIAPSVEAKRYGVKTGMRLNEAKMICPQIIGVPAHPVKYREAHIRIINVLRNYSDDVLPKSIDEAAVNLTSYRLVYKDIPGLARQIKGDLLESVGECVTCSIGVAPNTFLAKLATDIEKPNGFVQITPENVDGYLANMVLTDLPGIGRRNERRLELIGIKNPLQMRYTSPGILKKAFGGIAGYYWHSRLNFGEVDYYTNDYKAMSAARTIAPQLRTPEKLDAMLVSICTKLEQRLVKARQFCRRATFFVRYKNLTSWETAVRFTNPLQDALELYRFLRQKIEAFEGERGYAILNPDVKQMGIAISEFLKEDMLQYSLFDNRMKQDKVRRVMYDIKDKWGKYAVRKATETVEKSHMHDAIGFGSVKDLMNTDTTELNQFLLEEVDE